MLSVLYLVFNEGYLPGGDRDLRPELSNEAIRLARLLCQLLAAAHEASGLLALMLMTEARRASRISADGELVSLADQDRRAWDRELIAEGHALVRRLIEREPVEPNDLFPGQQVGETAAHRPNMDGRAFPALLNCQTEIFASTAFGSRNT